jgi:hypothetical protein
MAQWGPGAFRPSDLPVRIGMPINHGQNRVTPILHRFPRSAVRYSVVDLTHQNKNRSILVQGSEISIRRVSTRLLTRGDAE